MEWKRLVEVKKMMLMIRGVLLVRISRSYTFCDALMSRLLVDIGCPTSVKAILAKGGGCRLQDGKIFLEPRGCKPVSTSILPENLQSHIQI